MKTLTIKFSTLIIILALTIGNQIQAKDISFSPDKKETVKVKIHPSLLSFIAQAFDISDSDLIVLHNQMKDIKTLTLAYLEHEIEFTLEENTFEITGLHEDSQSQQLEDWMFEELFSDEEEEAVLEDWMFDTEYFDGNVKPI
ncbi:MAG: hypothetical protein U9N86_15930 [Bacteroidota bacterium]|nr:hypothetical protein [Bacteroidota bacterium]